MDASISDQGVEVRDADRRIGIEPSKFEPILDRIKDLTDKVLIPSETAMVKEGAVPTVAMDAIIEAGLFGMTLPERWGGLGLSMEQQVLLTMEFTRASAVYRSRFSTTIGLCSQLLLDHGTESQKDRYLARMAAGRCVAAFALTEANAGSDAGAVATTASRDGEEWVIDGEKRYITNGGWADLFVVFARSDGVDGGRGRLSGFLVDGTERGIERRPASIMNGHEAGPVAEVTFTRVRVAHDALIGGVDGQGLQQALRGINHARTHVAATAIGQGTRVLEEAVQHVMTRRQFGSRLADIGWIEGMLGESYARLAAGRALVLDCARAFDRGPIPRNQIAASKLYCTEAAFAIADRALQALGGEGIVGNHPIPRMWRDLRALRIYEGASEVHQRNLGRQLKALHERSVPIRIGTPEAGL